ncbi:MAG: hypothetical protein K9L32_09665 [Chromatiaceae bacterium]|nr:hypothetical protein [Chromatiaceae bacterium]
MPRTMIPSATMANGHETIIANHDERVPALGKDFAAKASAPRQDPQKTLTAQPHLSANEGEALTDASLDQCEAGLPVAPESTGAGHRGG